MVISHVPEGSVDLWYREGHPIRTHCRVIIEICDRFYGSSEHNCQSIIHHGSGACVTESMSVLTDPATCGTLNSELTNCPCTAAVLGELAAQWQPMMVTLPASRTRDPVITESGEHAVENMSKDTDRRDRKPTSIEGRRAALPEDLVKQHTTRRVCT